MPATDPAQDPEPGTAASSAPDSPTGADPVPRGAVAPSAPPRSRRRPAMWLAAVGVAASIAVAVLVGPLQGCLTLAGLMVLLAVVRGVSPGPGPYGISIRSRAFDVVALLGSAVVIALLAVMVRENM